MAIYEAIASLLGDKRQKDPPRPKGRCSFGKGKAVVPLKLCQSIHDFRPLDSRYERPDCKCKCTPFSDTGHGYGALTADHICLPVDHDEAGPAQLVFSKLCLCLAKLRFRVRSSLWVRRFLRHRPDPFQLGWQDRRFMGLLGAYCARWYFASHPPGGHAHFIVASIIRLELLLVMIKQATRVTSTESPCKCGLRQARGGKNKQAQTVTHQWQNANKERLNLLSESSWWSPNEQSQEGRPSLVSRRTPVGGELDTSYLAAFQLPKRTGRASLLG